MTKYGSALRAAFPLTLPICAAFLFLGISYGLYMTGRGFAPLYPICTSALVFAGSMEFVLVSLLLGPFDPLNAFFIALTVNSRHLFYGLSMLEKYKDTGLKKLYLIFGMCDESFAINCSVKIPEGIDKGWFMTFVTFLNQCYWVTGVTTGALAGSRLNFDAKGLDFALTALFLAIFAAQWQGEENHGPSLLGLALPFFCLLLWGPEAFLPPSLALLLALFVFAFYFRRQRS